MKCSGVFGKMGKGELRNNGEIKPKSIYLCLFLLNSFANQDYQLFFYSISDLGHHFVSFSPKFRPLHQFLFSMGNLCFYKVSCYNADMAYYSQKWYTPMMSPDFEKNDILQKQDKYQILLSGSYFHQNGSFLYFPYYVCNT